MIKYALVEAVPSNDNDEWGVEFYIKTVRSDYSGIQEAEKARTAYLVLYPNVDPQNAQVISYKETDDIPF